MFMRSTPVGGLFWDLASLANVRCSGITRASLTDAEDSTSLARLEAASKVVLDKHDNMALQQWDLEAGCESGGGRGVVMLMDEAGRL